ncbi:hypothetical protein SME41J_46520 [Serratia marcescens]|nr:hypothetical protein SME41J_46520 [Serratia marcescens]
MNNWPIEKLKGKINIKHGFPFKGEFFSEQKTEFIVLTPGNFHESGGFKRQPGKEKFYTGEFPEEYIHSKGDIIVAMTEQAAGLLGSCARVPESGLYLHNQRLGLIKTNPQYLLKDYVYYLFRTNMVREQIRLTSSGSKVKHTSPERIYDVKVPLPDVKEQQKIVDFLDVIEEKLELNNRINTELESMAKTLYDYWFVQFDFPDSNGRPYKTAGGKMEYNTKLKREIPAGWTNCQLENIIERSGTGLNPRDNFVLGNGDNYYVTIKNINNGKIILDDKCDKIDDNALKIIDRRSQLQGGDILFTSIEPVGVTYFIHDKPTNWNINESVFTLRPNIGMATSEYLYFLLSSDEMKVFTKNSSSGSVHKGIRHGVLKNYTLAYSGKKIIDEFSNNIKPILKRVYFLEQENQSLTKLRDWLLPLLMNGQVTVK